MSAISGHVGIMAEVDSPAFLQNSQNTRVLDASDSSHSSTLLKGLYSFYKEQKYCDVILKTSDEQKIQVHRVVLASASRYFDSLFAGKFREAESDEVVLPAVDGSIMNCLIEFAYTGNIHIDAENVLALLHASNYFGVDFVEKSCAEFLKLCIDDDSCLTILQIADTFALEHLREVAKRHALRNFTNASKGNGFLTLPCQLLKELLGSGEISVVDDDRSPCDDEGEKVLLQAALKFVEHDRAGRVQFLHELVSLIRLPSETITCYFQTMASHSLFGSFSDTELNKIRDKSSDGESLVSTRKFARSVVIKGRPLGYWGHVKFIPREAADDESRYVKGMKVWVEHQGERTTLKGMKVFYSHGSPRKVVFGTKIGQKYEFHLQKNEKIVKTDIQMRWQGIDQITFYTDKQDVKGHATTYGPYGEGASGVYSESPAGSYGYLAGVSAACSGTHMSLQFTWRAHVFPGELELPLTSYEVNDHVLARTADNLYFPGVVKAMENGQVHILLDDGEAVTHSAADISAVIPDKVPDPTTLKMNSHVIASCKSPFYHIGFVVTANHDGNVGFKCDQIFCRRRGKYIPVDKVRLYPEHTIPHAIGARVFARWTNGLHYRGFITKASDRTVLVNYDSGDTITLDKSDRTAVILDVLPQVSEILQNERVIGFYDHTPFYPGHVISIDTVNEEFEVEFDDPFDMKRPESLYEIRLIPRE